MLELDELEVIVCLVENGMGELDLVLLIRLLFLLFKELLEVLLVREFFVFIVLLEVVGDDLLQLFAE